MEIISKGFGSGSGNIYGDGQTYLYEFHYFLYRYMHHMDEKIEGTEKGYGFGDGIGSGTGSLSGRGISKGSGIGTGDNDGNGICY